MFKEEKEDFSEPFTFCVAEDECQIVEEDFVDFEFWIVKFVFINNI